MEKKEALFKTKNIKKWKFTGNEMELIGREKTLLANKKLAFPFILSDETVKLKKQQEMCHFYSNQLLAEMRRVGRDNGISLIEHFLAASEIQQEYSEQQRNIWAQFHEYFNQGDVIHDDDDIDG